MFEKIGYVDEVIKESLYCVNCSRKLSSSKKCENIDCFKFSQTATEYNTFTFVSIEQQLKHIIDIYEEINIIDRLSNNKFVDIINGKYYNKIKRDNVLHLMIYSDGIELAKSSLNHYWPVVLNLIELPLSMRISKINNILFGIWEGNKKPTSASLFGDLKKEITDLYIVGKSTLQRQYTLSPYGFIADAPAKALALCVMYHNSYLGCPYCYSRGFRSSNFNKMLFNQENFPLRTSNDYKYEALEGTEDSPYMGLYFSLILLAIIL